MWLRLSHLPLFVQLFGITSALMLVPSAHALALENYAEARSFFYSGLLGLFLIFMIALATSNRKIEETSVQQLASLALSFFLIPAFCAIPEYDAIRTTYFINTYLDMVSAFTTTGFLVFEPEKLSNTVHLWRALVAWFGGGLIWLVAIAILAPMNLGGFEVTSGRSIHQTHYLTAKERQLFLYRNFYALLPLYLGLTGLLWLALSICGIPGFESLIFAMSVLSTSGITAVATLSDFEGIWFAEVVILVFLTFAITRGISARERSNTGLSNFSTVTELKIAAAIIIFTTLFLLFLQIFYLLEAGIPIIDLFTIKMIWGNLFTIMSFLTTNGWTSNFWFTTNEMSGFAVPGALFLGLVLIGGGVATTAGGVKLLRVYALYRNAIQEMDRLIHPSAIGQSRSIYQNELRGKAFIAWIFFMLFIISLAVITLLLSAFGLTFETALIASVSALSTTGPLPNLVMGSHIDFSIFNNGSKMILAAAMVLGKLEILVLLALFTSEIWRGQ